MKLLFVCNNMHIGGIQKSLINLLKELSKSHDITLFLFSKNGELMSDIPKGIDVICGNGFTQILGMSQAEAKEKGICTALWRAFWAVVTKAFGMGFSFGILTRGQKMRDKYDVAISFMQNSAYKMFYGGCNEFVINSVKADRKISFVHCDFKNYYGNNRYNREYYKNFDKIACVSDSCKKVFDGVCPQFSDKTYSVHNCYDFDEMNRLSCEYEADYTEDAVNLFTAARISEEKGIFRMIPILEKLKDKNFVWRIAGFGPMYETAVSECEKRGLKGKVEFLGMLKNPYPYFKKSDMLLVPSYDEAAPMVFGEAEFFGLPVFTTDTTSAKELVEDKRIGFVCENTDGGIEQKLSELLDRKELIFEKKKIKDVNNDMALSEFEGLIL